MLKRVNWAKSLIMLFLSFALCVGFVGTGSAQPDKDTQQKQPAQKQKQKMGPTMGTMKSGDAQKLKQMQQEMKKLQKKLGKIKKQALEENKGLKKKEQNLKNFIQKKMDKNMADKDVDNARMDEIRKEIRENKDMEQSKKGELIKEYKKNAKGYQEAQTKTLQDSEVQKKRKEYKKALMAGMKEVNPETGKIMDKLKNLNRKMRRMKRQKMQQMRQMRKQPQKGMAE